MDHDLKLLLEKLVGFSEEFGDLKRRILKKNARYASTLEMIRFLTANTTKSAQRTVAAARFSSEASEHCLTVAKQAAIVPLIRAAAAAADAAKEAVLSAIKSAASTEATAATAASAVSNHIKGHRLRPLQWRLMLHKRQQFLLRKPPINLPNERIAANRRIH